MLRCWKRVRFVNICHDVVDFSASAIGLTAGNTGCIEYYREMIFLAKVKKTHQLSGQLQRYNYNHGLPTQLLGLLTRIISGFVAVKEGFLAHNRGHMSGTVAVTKRWKHSWQLTVWMQTLIGLQDHCSITVAPIDQTVITFVDSIKLTFLGCILTACAAVSWFIHPAAKPSSARETWGEK